MEILKRNKSRNVVVAASSIAFAILNYAWQFAHPTTAVQILMSMEKRSAPLSVIGNNGKPTVVDFWAPWCSNCRVGAPTLRAVELEYGDRVNFVSIDADLRENWPLIRLFGVDSIPHLALVDGGGVVETALVGPVSRNVLRADIDAMLGAHHGTGGDCGGGGGGGGAGGDDGGGVVAATIATATTAMPTTTVCHDDLPYTMYDAFGNRPESRRVNFAGR